MPQIETERLAVEDGDKGLPCRVRLNVKESAQVGQEGGKLGFGQRIRLRAGKQTGRNLLVQAGVQESLTPGFAKATQNVGLRGGERSSRTAKASTILNPPGRGGPTRCSG